MSLALRSHRPHLCSLGLSAESNSRCDSQVDSCGNHEGVLGVGFSNWLRNVGATEE